METSVSLRHGKLYKTLAHLYNRSVYIYEKRLKKRLNASGFKALISLLVRLFSLIFLHDYVKVTILMIQTLWLIILLLFLTYLPLSSMDQATDVFRVISEGSEPGWVIATHLSVFACALTVWYSCRMLFILFDFNKIKYSIYGSDMPEQQATGARELMRWIPPMMGVVPFLLLIQGLSGHQGGSWQIVLVLGSILFYFWILFQNSQFLKVKQPVQPNNEPDQENSISDEEESDHLSLMEHKFLHLRIRYQILTLLLYAACFGLFVICAIPMVNLWFSRLVGVVAGVFLALSMWVFLAQALLLLDHKHKAPIAVLLLGIILFFWNTNNHQIRTLGDAYFDKKKLGDRSITSHFIRWVESRKTDIAAWPADSSHTRHYPIYIVAAEGGGLRAGYWTAAMLGELSQQIPGFYHRTYALSTVSGGSVGAAIYTKLYADSLQCLPTKGCRPDATVDKYAKEILHQDYLSPLTTAFLVPDMLQKLSPVGIAAFDRAKYLEDALSYEYGKVTQPWKRNEKGDGYSFDEPFMNIWSGKSLYAVPSLFMNCTRVENGAKAVLSNLLIDGQSFNGANGKEVIDLQEEIHRNIRISTAAFMSARFPIVTPPATVQHTDAHRTDWSNFVDGGYIDNSGLETALAIMTSIRNAPSVVEQVYRGDTTAIKAVKQALEKVEVHLILIKNSEQKDDEPAPVRGLYELKAPLLAFVNSWDRHIGSKLNVARSYLRLAAKPDPTKSTIGVDSTLLLFDVDRRQELVPLGWYISDKARQCMDRQADSLPKLDGYRQSIQKNLKHMKD